MGSADRKVEQLELAAEIAGVITRRRAAWREDHGAGADYGPLIIGGLARATNEAFLGIYAETHNNRLPSFDHLAAVVGEFQKPMLFDAALRYGLDARAITLIGLAIFGAPAHD